MGECDRGYDPTGREPFPTETAHFVDALPRAAIVNPAFLPPVGQQGTTASPGAPGSCCAWASVYGLATFTAARAGRTDPSAPAGQASPAQIYIDVLNAKKVTPGTCAGSSFGDYFPILQASGVERMAAAPYISDCPSLWLAYQNRIAVPDAAFKIGKTACVATSDLESIKQVLASGRALCYGTRLFTDWSQYTGGATPYWGNGDILTSKETGAPAGHCMLIIGYNDETGALLIQNSEGKVWGIAGYVWMAYSTFQFLSQGQAFYAAD
ncbi:MAG: C1 family peptidase [Acetobacteraceae bacterium]